MSKDNNTPPPEQHVEGYLHRLKGEPEWHITLPSGMGHVWGYQNLFPDKIEIVPLTRAALATTGGRDD